MIFSFLQSPPQGRLLRLVCVGANTGIQAISFVGGMVLELGEDRLRMSDIPVLEVKFVRYQIQQRVVSSSFDFDFSFIVVVDEEPRRFLKHTSVYVRESN